MSTCAKRVRRASSDDVTPPPSPLLSNSEVNDLTALIHSHRDTLLSWLSGERETERKSKLRTAINDMCDAYTRISNAYVTSLATDNALNYFKSTLDKACDGIKQASSSLCSAVNNLNSNSQKGSYADATKSSARSDGGNNLPAAKVILTRGKAFTLNATNKIIIAPSESMKDNFPTSRDTRAALWKYVDPVKMKMRVDRVRLGPQCSVIIEGEDVNEAAFTNLSELSAAGLIVKRDLKMKPRVVIHDIPVNLASDDIIKCVVEQNLPEASADELKMVYLYPARNKKSRSCIVELSPAYRSRLINRKRVTIGWSSCRIDDHISITQCFNCCGFGHIASTCKQKVCCGKCAGEHDTKICASPSLLKCTNCTAAKHSNVSHSACDRSKCPILRNKIDAKIALTDYDGSAN